MLTAFKKIEMAESDPLLDFLSAFNDKLIDIHDNHICVEDEEALVIFYDSLPDF